jgi:hypothetical protein
MSLHAASIVGATAESASGPPSLTFDEVLLHPPTATNAIARTALRAARAVIHGINDMARPIDRVAWHLSRRAPFVISATRRVGNAVYVVAAHVPATHITD